MNFDTVIYRRIVNMMDLIFNINFIAFSQNPIKKN
jgi:hypothetical protein